MKLAPEMMLDFIQNVSREIIKSKYPDEGVLFDPVWAVMKEGVRKWDRINPEGWSFARPKKRMLAVMGLDRNQVQSEIANPRVIALVAGVLMSINNLNFEPDINGVNRIIDDCSENFRIMAEFTRNIKPILIPLCLAIPEIIRASRGIALTNEEIAKRIKESVKSLPQVFIGRDTLEISFNGKPKVIINGKEAKQFRTKYKQFANLVLLAAARKTGMGEGWLDRKDDLDLGENFQALSEIRSWISPLLNRDVAPIDVIKASTENVGRIKLDAFKPDDIKIDKNICEYRIESKRRVKEWIDKAEMRKIFLERGARRKLLDLEEFDALVRDNEIMHGQMRNVQKAAEMMGWEFKDKQWKNLYDEAEKILKLCGYEKRKDRKSF